MKNTFTLNEWQALEQATLNSPPMDTDLSIGDGGHIEDHKRIAEYISYFPRTVAQTLVKNGDDDWVIRARDGNENSATDSVVEMILNMSAESGLVAVFAPEVGAVSELTTGSQITMFMVGPRAFERIVWAADKVLSSDSEEYTLGAQVENLETEVSGITSSLETLITSNSSLENKVSDLESDNSTLNSTVSTLESNVATLTSDKEALEGQVSTLESTIADLTTRLEALENPTNPE